MSSFCRRRSHTGWLVVVAPVFKIRLACSQPNVFANARHVALAPTAVRNRRRVNLEPIAGTLHYSRALVGNLVSLIQEVQKGWLGHAIFQEPRKGDVVRSTHRPSS